MKIVKLVSVTLAFALTCSATQAQSTPEAIIGQCPDMPSVSHLAAPSDNQAARAAIEAFHRKIQTLRENAQKTQEPATDAAKAAATQDAERIVRQTTGRSVAELQNMSQAEQEAFAQQMVSQQLSGAGLGNMSLAQLQALEGKSDDEIAAAMTGSGVTIGGLTPEEIKAMENMTDAQRTAYMQQGDRMQRMQAAAPSPQQAKNAQTQARNAQTQADVVNEMKRITDRWQEIDRLNEKETQDVVRKIAEIDARYAPQIAAIKPTGLAAGHETTYTESEARAVRALINARDSEQYTLWRNQVSQMQGRIKTKMADVARYDELMAQSMTAGGMTSTARTMPSIGFSIAGQYLDVTSSVTRLPEK